MYTEKLELSFPTTSYRRWERSHLYFALHNSQIALVARLDRLPISRLRFSGIPRHFTLACRPVAVVVAGRRRLCRQNIKAEKLVEIQKLVAFSIISKAVRKLTWLTMGIDIVVMWKTIVEEFEFYFYIMTMITQLDKRNKIRQFDFYTRLPVIKIELL